MIYYFMRNWKMLKSGNLEKSEKNILRAFAWTRAKNLRRLLDKYAVARTEHDALVKSTTKIFSNFVAFSEKPNFTWNDK